MSANAVNPSRCKRAANFRQSKPNSVAGNSHKSEQFKTVVNAKCQALRQRTPEVGLLQDAYHSVTKENVKHSVEAYNPSATNLLDLDFVPNSEIGTMSLSEAEKFVTLVKEKTGRFPRLYSGESFLREKVGSNTTTVLKNCFLWIARYSSEKPVAPPAWTTFTLWQYTDGNAGDQPHQVPGIGRCDRDKFNGDDAGLRKLWGV